MNSLAAEKKYTISPAAKAFAVLTGAVMTGFLWRVRGDGGFGGMWGMFAVAAGVTLLIYALFGERKKMSYGMIPVCIIAMAATVGGWGTVNTQMAGYITSSANFTGEAVVRIAHISPYSGLLIMLCLGFGWMPLFALLLGSLFSAKRYSVASYALLIGVFIVSSLAFKASVSHALLNTFSPQATQLFNDGLADRGLDITAMKAYITHFSSDAWAKKIPGGRNYFTSIEIISHALAAAVTLIVQRFALKDKAASVIALLVNLVCAVSITVADIFLVIGFENNIFRIMRSPWWVLGNQWSLWEFFTGFFIGLGIMLILALLPKKIVAGNAEVTNNITLPKNRVALFLYHGLITLFFSLGLTAAVALGQRVSEQLEARFDELHGFFGENAEMLITVAAGAVMLAISLLLALKNNFRRQLPVPVPTSPRNFARVALPVEFTLLSAIYFFTGNAYFFDVKWSKITPPTLFKALMEGWGTVTIIMVASAALFYILYFVLMKLSQRKISRG